MFVCVGEVVKGICKFSCVFDRDADAAVVDADHGDRLEAGGHAPHAGLDARPKHARRHAAFPFR